MLRLSDMLWFPEVTMKPHTCLENIVTPTGRIYGFLKIYFKKLHLYLTDRVDGCELILGLGSWLDA